MAISGTVEKNGRSIFDFYPVNPVKRVKKFRLDLHDLPDKPKREPALLDIIFREIFVPRHVAEFGLPLSGFFKR